MSEFDGDNLVSFLPSRHKRHQTRIVEHRRHSSAGTRGSHLADALPVGNNVIDARHVLLAQPSIRPLRQAPNHYLNGGHRLSEVTDGNVSVAYGRGCAGEG
jgi:hypothetical protein